MGLHGVSWLRAFAPLRDKRKKKKSSLLAQICDIRKKKSIVHHNLSSLYASTVKFAHQKKTENYVST